MEKLYSNLRNIVRDRDIIIYIIIQIESIGPAEEADFVHEPPCQESLVFFHGLEVVRNNGRSGRWVWGLAEGVLSGLTEPRRCTGPPSR